MKRIKDRLPLVIPFALLAMLDGGVTLFFQPEAYWTDHTKYLESNPFFAHMLSVSPWAYVGTIFCWILLLSSSMVFTPRLLGLGIGTAFIYGHSVGALGWIRHFCFTAHWNNIPYHIFVAFLLIWAISDQIEKHIKEKES